MFFTVLGVLSALLFIIGDIPYLLDTIRRTTRPHRVTWGVVLLLNVTGFANQWASGATNSLWLFGAAVFMTGAIFVASLVHGVGGSSKLDIFSVITAFVGVALWQIFDSPLLSIVSNIVIALVALRPTFKKARSMPESETRIAWLLGMCSAILATISVGKLDVSLLLLPITSVLLQAYMVYLLYVLPGRTVRLQSATP